MCFFENERRQVMEKFTQQVETWYAVHRRDLPWRDTGDAYRIWLSEIILQQTRVAQGLDYYLRFVERFPDVFALAAANEDEVLRLWQGLGYYSRARNLHAAARRVAELGAFPTTYEGVRALKGVGDYTAAAVCSMAYGQPHAVVDGNVYRVLSRHFGVETPIDTAQGKREFAELADALLDRKQPGLYNQAMMDFGALQCTPRQPDCLSCPLAGSCRALETGRVADFPVKAKRTVPTDRHFVYIYVRCGADILLRRRPSGDIWQGLYEPLLIEFTVPADERAVMAHPLVAAMGAATAPRLVVRGVKHVLTHRRLFADLYVLDAPEDMPVPEGFMRIPETERGDYAVSRLVEMLYEKVSEKR